MRKYLHWWFILWTCMSSQILHAGSLDQQIAQTIGPMMQGFSDLVFFEITIAGVNMPVIILWLIAGALFFTVYFRFISFWGFRYALGFLRGDFDKESSSGEVSHFQALATALSGTIGIGNIGAVAVAISIGGPGATFWLIIAGFLGMTTKFVECTLGLKYRQVHSDGSVSGGPMQFLQQGFKEKGLQGLGEFLARFYALGIVIGCFGIGNMFQANQAYVQILGVTGGEGSILYGQAWVFGLLLALSVGLVIIGGVKKIAHVTEKLVPLMAVSYLLGAFMVIGYNYEFIPAAAVAIVKGAFAPEGVAGGVLGVIFWGFKRALLSNEAGIGSASIAHSAAKTEEPLSEGFVSLLEPFIDTVVICTITALVIVTSMLAYPEIFKGIEPGVAMTSAAFRQNMPWSFAPLSLIVLLFAYSTIISWSYYGLKGWTFLFGHTQRMEHLFKTIYCAAIIIGCSVKLTPILAFSDASIFLICIPNLIGLYMLAPDLRKDLREFLSIQKKI